MMARMAEPKLMCDQKVVITGAGKGIGRAIALAYASEGASLVLAARTESDLLDVARRCEDLGVPRKRIWTLAVDLSNAQGVDRLADFAEEHAGLVTSLVCNAGVYCSGHVRGPAPVRFPRTRRVDVRGLERLPSGLSRAPSGRARGAPESNRAPVSRRTRATRTSGTRCSI